MFKMLFFQVSSSLMQSLLPLLCWPLRTCLALVIPPAQISVSSFDKCGLDKLLIGGQTRSTCAPHDNILYLIQPENPTGRPLRALRKQKNGKFPNESKWLLVKFCHFTFGWSVSGYRATVGLSALLPAWSLQWARIGLPAQMLHWKRFILTFYLKTR